MKETIRKLNVLAADKCIGWWEVRRLDSYGLELVGHFSDGSGRICFTHFDTSVGIWIEDTEGKTLRQFSLEDNELLLVEDSYLNKEED